MWPGPQTHSAAGTVFLFFFFPICCWCKSPSGSPMCSSPHSAGFGFAEPATGSMKANFLVQLISGSDLATSAKSISIHFRVQPGIDNLELCYTNAVLNKRLLRKKSDKRTHGKYQNPKNTTQAAATRGIGGLHVSCSWWSLALVSYGNDGLSSSSICSRDGAVTTETTQSLDIVKQSYFAVSDGLILWATLIYRKC